jgi:YHS domain-containing protein
VVGVVAELQEQRTAEPMPAVGVEYHFCSLEFANAFSGNPRRYAPRPTDADSDR